MHHGPNMTPMVDVVMVILIFFMATASVLGPDWFLKTSLPRAAASDAPAGAVVCRLEVDRDGASAVVTCAAIGLERVALDRAGVERVAAALKTKRDAGEKGSLVVLISPSAEVLYQDLISLHEVCERLEILKVGVVPR
jgi:biopolymer transport protein ExbD